ncbi:MULTISPECIES: DUF350 domain-containing protein [Myxococcus]|uniref:DUF350 domain-containing protein n=1 Tax=Myxococcus xanthus TaxID=34 RepID=A0AAE6KUV7_MYXXA|nr:MULTISPECIES: DUF350 domain-containing protein [Myxococcus]QDE70837.1 hypothetical protein BHS09_29830 [Myxococcus xanthus]QDE78116.1 hypothetical protein BHS08_29850 [Myxococcus xanthus]QDE85504.1 hypothetical protein BHS07_30435 [Myxococcus xanthus]QDE99660.1 hypothetical protein BHS05_29640 [Myxococcus xanthus]QDF07388.1 hypothetical protein BHS04_29950 [Myxococcus xanthus]
MRGRALIQGARLASLVMDLVLLFVGLIKVVFGGLVAALGIWLALRGLSRILGANPVEELRQGNVAACLVHASSMVSLGLLVQHAVQATSDALDLTVQNPPLHLLVVGRLVAVAVLHVGLSLGVGVTVLGTGVLLFDRMTPGIDELAEVRKGNVAAALILSAILLVLALLTAPGLQAALNGLIPFPQLPEGTLRAPA